MLTERSNGDCVYVSSERDQDKTVVQQYKREGF